MKSVENEADVNDAFNDILFCEENIIKRAFEDGIERGKFTGFGDGYDEGRKTGLQLGMVIGFYKGVVDTLLKHPDLVNDNVNRTLLRLKDSLESFPKCNDHDRDILSQFNDIRALCKKLHSVLKLDLDLPFDWKEIDSLCDRNALSVNNIF